MEQNWQKKSDEDLARQVQNGNTQLFGLIVDRYETKIGRYAKKFVYDQDDIKDVLQEIFIKAYVNIKSFDTARKLSPWIYRIAHNELVNTLRKKKKNTLPLFNLDTFLPRGFSENEINKENDHRDVKQMINTCLAALEPKYKEPTILYYLDELSYSEISEILQIPISTVGVRIKRAREKMQKAYLTQKKYEQGK